MEIEINGKIYRPETKRIGKYTAIGVE